MVDVKEIRHRAMVAGLRPPPRLSLSEWADEYFRLSAESAAAPGRWTCLPYQREIMDSITSPTVTSVSLMKSARIGYTLMISAAVGYYIHQAPAAILLVQPTVDDAKNFSKETIAPMLRDVPVLSRIVFEDSDDAGPRDSGNTILHKRFPGGVLSMVGANSGAGFRRVSRKVVAFDEVDAYPPSAGSDGDPIMLGTKRAEFFWDRKIIAGSTPLVAGYSRIEALYEAGDRRRYYVPCPECGHMDFMVFAEHEGGGHYIKWPEGKPDEAYLVCSGNGCVIEHKHKRDMVARGAWRAAGEFKGHASFHISALYSYSPNSSWGDIAKEFLAAKGNSETLRVFCNTVLGETWKEKGEAPDWERLFARREAYPIGSIPEGVKFLTAGVDVQKDRFVYEIVGWGFNKESWSIESGVLAGDTANEKDWAPLDALLSRSWEAQSIRMLAVDSGYNTQQVYNWARRYPMARVIATKGVRQARTIIDHPSAVDVTVRGVKMARGYKVWTVGTDVAKAELYGWLRLPEGAASYCHFPEYGEEYFKQLTGEHLVTTVSRQGFKVFEWQVIPGRENHWLDARVYARAAAALLGLDRYAAQAATPDSAPATSAPVIQSESDTRLPFLSKSGRPWLGR